MSIAQLIEENPIFNEDEAAKFLGVKPQTLSVWRCTGRNDLPYCKIGRLVRYRLADLKQFLDTNTIGNSAAE